MIFDEKTTNIDYVHVKFFVVFILNKLDQVNEDLSPVDLSDEMFSGFLTFKEEEDDNYSN